MGAAPSHRVTQDDTPEVVATKARLHSNPALERQRERHLEALSHAQGGRWLEADTVEHEQATGYGLHHHTSQAASPEVKAALAAGHAPAAEAADEKLRQARAAAQGGRWMDESNMPRGLLGQAEAPEVRAALERSHDPVLQAESERKRAARAAAQGGRWLE